MICEKPSSKTRRMYGIIWIIERESKYMKHFVSLKLEGQSRVRARDLRLLKQAALTSAPGPV